MVGGVVAAIAVLALLGASTSGEVTTDTCAESPAVLSESPRGFAWLGTFVRTFGPEGHEDAQEVWDVDEVIHGDVKPVDGSVSFFQDLCSPVIFREGARYVLTTSERRHPTTHNTVAWEVEPDGAVRLVTYLPPSAYDRVYHEVDTLEDVIALIRSEELPPAADGRTPEHSCAPDDGPHLESSPKASASSGMDPPPSPTGTNAWPCSSPQPSLPAGASSTPHQ